MSLGRVVKGSQVRGGDRARARWAHLPAVIVLCICVLASLLTTPSLARSPWPLRGPRRRHQVRRELLCPGAATAYAF
jgi:hypothetical protein